MLTLEKKNQLGAFLAEDEARAKKLGAMSAEDAAKEINAQGFDFTAADLAEFAESVQETSGELDEAALEGVSGGGYSWERFKSFWRGFYAGWCAG